ncbi:SusC/RagA family TonB-linked outer membrane protein [Chitinophaga sp. 30R24]|uniref:SusC/RagA family TonB-linked outer membrane protein n=1 Tax=Chitinophaga sp. 30R24 TaxID=3248838 RepID=UPI003B917D93
MTEFYARRIGGSVAVALLMQLYALPGVAAYQPPQQDVLYATIRQQQLPMKEVLTMLEARYKVRINYTGNTIKDLRTTVPTAKAASGKMLDYLRSFLSPFNLEAEEAGQDNYFIYRKDVPAAPPSSTPAPRQQEVVADKEETAPVMETPEQEVPQHPPVKGQVLQEDGVPVPGATVVVKGTQNGVHTNADGRFELKNVPESAVLVISYMGFKTQEVKVSKRALAVTLHTNTQSLKDVVVNGYQSIKKDNFTGSAVTITGEELKRFNPQNILASVQSFDPSFKLVENNIMGSNPNALPNINVRGTTALPSGDNKALSRNQLSSATNLPLFVIDGYPVPVQTVYDLDPNRIAAITLLKDAAATAVYGSRAANGVLVITTRPPKEGKLALTYGYELNVSTPDLTAYHLLDASQKLEYEKLAGVYKSALGQNPDEVEAQYYAKRRNVLAGVNTYWLAQPLSTDFGHKHSVSLEGGSQSFKYIIDGRYQTNAGVMKGSGRDRYSLATNLQYNLKNNKVLFRNQFTVSQINGKESPYRDFSNYARMNPYFPKTDSTGRLLRELDKWNAGYDNNSSTGYKVNNVLNPLYEATLGSFNKSEYLEFVDAFSAEYNVTPALRLRADMSLTKRKTTTDQFISPYSNDFFDKTGDDLKDRGTYDFAFQDEMQFNTNLVLNYNKGVGDHFFNSSLGINMQDAKTGLKAFSAQGFPNDRFTDITFARTYKPNAAPTGTTYEERLAGAFGSVNYSYMNRFLMDATLRIDGSSKFGANSRMAPFWSYGLGWNMQNEEFLRNTAVSQLKLRATTGLTGEVSFPAYLSNTTYEYYVGDWYSTGVGAHFKAYGNDRLKWQRTHNYDLGMELGLFHDRLYFAPRYYYKLTKDLLADINVAPSTGFYQYKENLGEMVNKGYEFNLRGNIYRTRNLSVNLNANMVHNTNVITKISNALKAHNDDINKQQNDNDDLKSVALLRYQEGQSMNTIYAVKSLGIDPETGKEIFLNKDGSKTYIYDVKNTVPVGDQTPKLEGYFGGNVIYKSFMLEVSFYTKFGGDYYNQTLLDRVENADPRYNVDARVLSDRWRNPGDITFYKNIADQSITRASSRFVQKENRLEFKSVYFSYDAPESLYKRLKMQSLRFSLNMNDIGYWSTIEAERGIDYPFARSFTFSLQTRF